MSHETLSKNQVETAIRGSRSMESAWRVYSKPQDYRARQVAEALRYLLEQMRNLNLAIDTKVGGIDPEIYDRVFMGIYHHGIEVPPELKYKSPRRN